MAESGIQAFLKKFGTLGELLAAAAADGRWWVIPITLSLLLAVLAVLVWQAAQVVLPWSYQ